MKQVLWLWGFFFWIGCSTSHPQKDSKTPQMNAFLDAHTMNSVAMDNKIFQGQFEIFNNALKIVYLTGNVYFTNQGKFHLEILNIVGLTNLLVVSHGTTLWLVEPQKKVCQTFQQGGGMIPLPETDIVIPYSAFISVLMSFPFHLGRVDQVGWKRHRDPHHPKEEVWNYGKTYYRFASTQDLLPKAMYMFDGNVGFKQEFLEWRESFEGQSPFFARKWILKTTQNVPRNQVTVTWKKILHKHRTVSESIFKKPSELECQVLD